MNTEATSACLTPVAKECKKTTEVSVVLPEVSYLRENRIAPKQTVSKPAIRHPSRRTKPQLPMNRVVLDSSVAAWRQRLAKVRRSYSPFLRPADSECVRDSRAEHIRYLQVSYGWRQRRF